MWHFTFKKFAPSSIHRHRRVNLFVSLSGIILIGVLLAACGGPATTAQATPTPPPLVQLTAATTPSPTPTIAPTDTPTPVPTVAPTQPPPTPTPPPHSGPGPAVLDLTPASMSIVGHLDCTLIGGMFNCQARVAAPSSNQHPLVWAASDNFANNVTFSPRSGSLSPGTSVTVSIFVPQGDCGVHNALFIFKGQSNIHTITWAC